MAKKLLTEEILNNILNDSFMGMIDQLFVINKYNFSQKTAERAMRKLNLINTYDHNINQIKDFISGMTSKEVAEKYNTSRENINAILKRRNIERRGTTYVYNTHFFDVIDTEEKAYFLGFIYADGCVFRNELKISINKRDIDILKKLKVCMQSNSKIHYKTNITDSGFISDIATINMSHKNLKNSLLSHGVVENKTFKIMFPYNSIPDSLLKHFIRGYFDGDGCISFYTVNELIRTKKIDKNSKRYSNNAKKYSISITGTINFLESLRKIFQDKCNQPVSAKLTDRFPERGTNIRTLSITGRIQVLTILDWLYCDSNIHLDRKYNKYLNLPR